MTDLLIQSTLSNLLLALILAVLAWAVQTLAKRPFLAHMLWILVLLKLITPPLATLTLASPASVADILSTNYLPATGMFSSEAPAVLALLNWKTVVVTLWLLGSVSVLVCSLWRIIRFDRLLKLVSTPAPIEIQQMATEIAECLGLRNEPSINITSARVSPMVWWLGGQVRVFLPVALTSQMEPAQIRCILAHELTHIHRRDHLVRWIEWLVCVCFWWNPIAWWARHNLRITEEICCDALVLTKLKTNSRGYAESLLSTLEILASSTIRPPAMASEINSGGFIERRIRMIVSRKPIPLTPRWLRGAVFLCAAAVLPLGLSLAQDSAETPRPVVSVYDDGYEYSGRRFPTIGELTPSLADEGIIIRVMHCDAEERVTQLMDLLRQREQVQLVFIKGINILDCGWKVFSR